MGEAQTILKWMGFYRTNVDGIRGPETVEAISKMQKRFDCQDTSGFVDKETIVVLLNVREMARKAINFNVKQKAASLAVFDTTLGDIMTIEEFRRECTSLGFTNDDGSGCFAVGTQFSYAFPAVPSDFCAGVEQVPEWATHVVWVNK